ncbi:chromosome partitioning protein [Cellulomonas sp. ICMP 17802]|uniref:chromosome partitioning protein n=1 Tax=Cellulomonas sp. ICMP 17802 TaxID=3239199 RepID=UPI00351ADD00
MSDGTDGHNTSTTTTRLPDIRAEVRDDGTGEISVDGVIERVRMANLAEAGAAITTRIAALAESVGRPVPVQVRDPDGVWSLLIHPDGLVDEAPGPLDDIALEAAAGAPGAPPASPSEVTEGTAGSSADEPSGDAAGQSGSADSSKDSDRDKPTSSGSASPTVGSAPRAGTADSVSTPTGGRPVPTTPGAGVPVSSPTPGAGAAAVPPSGGAAAAASAAASPATRPATEPTTPSPSRGPAASRATSVGASAPADSPSAAGGLTGSRLSAPPPDPSQPLPTLDDLLAARHPAAGGPAEHGWRAGVRRVTFGGIAPGPGRVERRRRVASASVRRTLDGPKTVVVINPKGGAHKTTATMLLAATFGLQRGGYTLAWDNNETRGTLGWRSSHADHTRTAVDLLNALPALGSGGTVRIGDLDGFVRTQPSEQFDVLASDENSASASSVDAASFSSLHQVLSRFYRVLVIDTGNNMRASNWQAAVGAADQIVVVSTVREDTAQSAAWALDALRATGHDEAVRRAVTVLSAPEPKVDKDLQRRLKSHFGALTRAVLEVPHDKALVAGGPIDYEALSTTTRDAWLRVTAVVADGL